MSGMKPERAFAMGQEGQEIRTLWISMGYNI